MSDNLKDDNGNKPGEGARAIVNAMVAQAIARCEREGIALEDFYRVMREEQALCPNGTLSALFERVFHRLGVTRN